VRRTPIAHVILPRPNLARPVPEFIWEAAQIVGRAPAFELEILMPVPALRRLTTLSRTARGLDGWPEGLDEALRALDPRPTLIPYLPLPGRSIESAAFAVAGALVTRRRALRPSVIHGSFLDDGGYVASVAARTLGARSVVVAHGTDVEMARNGSGGRRRRASASLRHASTVVAISRALSADIAHLGRRAEVVYYTVNADQFPLGVSRPDGPVLFVGKLGRGKGFDVLLEAIAKLDGVRLRAIGLPSADLDPRAEIRRLGIGDRVELIGETPHAELSGHYRQASCLVLPSRTEGLGIVLVEALLSGRPVITTDVGGPSEVAGGHNGRVIAPGDPVALAHAIHGVRAERWSPAMLRQSALPFTWDRMAPKLIEATLAS